MQSFKNFFTEEQLLEAQQYDLIFNDLGGFASDENVKPVITKVITDVKKALVKQDRIVWMLKRVKLYMYAVLYGGKQAKEYYDKNKSKYPAFNLMDEFIFNFKFTKEQSIASNPTKFENLIYNSFSRGQMFSLGENLETLKHYLSLDIPAINKTVFKNQSLNQIISEFHKLEQEENKKHSELVSATDEKDWEPVVKFNNGWVWFNLGVAECDAEGDAMGHCGNRGAAGATPDDRMLSLREPVKLHGKDYWKPHATFILDPNGNLGQMKGRANKKPAKYHTYIIKLLKQKDLIKGIVGGGYAPEENFALGDLTEKERDEVLDANPGLLNISDSIKKYGIEKLSKDSEFLYKCYSYIKSLNIIDRYNYTSSINITVDNIQDTILKWDLYHFESFKHFIKEMGNVQYYTYLMHEFNSYSSGYYSDIYVDNYQIDDFIIPQKYESKMDKALEKYDSIDIEYNNIDHEILKEYFPESYDVIRRSIEDGLQVAQSSEFSKQFKKRVADFIDQPNGTVKLVLLANGTVTELKDIYFDPPLSGNLCIRLVDKKSLIRLGELIELNQDYYENKGNIFDKDLADKEYDIDMENYNIDPDKEAMKSYFEDNIDDALKTDLEELEKIYGSKEKQLELGLEDDFDPITKMNVTDRWKFGDSVTRINILLNVLEKLGFKQIQKQVLNRNLMATLENDSTGQIIKIFDRDPFNLNANKIECDYLVISEKSIKYRTPMDTKALAYGWGIDLKTILKLLTTKV